MQVRTGCRTTGTIYLRLSNGTTEANVAVIDRAELRGKISISVDATLLRFADAYVAAHPGLDRSKVIDAALRQWCGRVQDAAMAAQYAEPIDDVTASELSDWRPIRNAAVVHQLSRRARE
jgi:hypothetical protein